MCAYVCITRDRNVRFDQIPSAQWFVVSVALVARFHANKSVSFFTLFITFWKEMTLHMHAKHENVHIAWYSWVLYILLYIFFSQSAYSTSTVPCGTSSKHCDWTILSPCIYVESNHFVYAHFNLILIAVGERYGYDARPQIKCAWKFRKLIWILNDAQNEKETNGIKFICILYVRMELPWQMSRMNDEVIWFLRTLQEQQNEQKKIKN